MSSSSLRQELFAPGAGDAAGSHQQEGWFAGVPNSAPVGGLAAPGINTAGAPGGSISSVPAQPIGSYGFDANEPPLLVELGINPEHVWAKTKSVLLPHRSVDQHIFDDSDFAGPVVFCLLLGVCLLFSGKLHFGVIYGLFAIGCTALYVVLNLMSQQKGADLSRVFSTLGYGMLPIVLLSAIKILFKLHGLWGTFLGIATILWSTFTATRFFEIALAMREQRYLIAYPTLLLYACFVLVVIF